MYTKFVEMWYTLHFVYIYSGLQKVFIIKIMYTILYKIQQNVYTDNCMQNESHISTYFDPFVNLFVNFA